MDDIEIKVGDWIDTPRFLKIQIDEVFESSEEAYKAGYHEPTHTRIPGWDIEGKNTGEYSMTFAAVRKNN